MSVIDLHADAGALPRLAGLRTGFAGRGWSTDRSLSRAWQRLEPVGTLPTQSQAFVAAVSRNFLDEAASQVLIATDSGGVTGILPLCHDEGRLSRLRMVGAREVFEPGDALAVDAAAVQRLAEELARQSRAVTLDRVPADSPLVPAIGKAMRGRGWVSIRPAMASPTLALDESWRQPEARFNSGRRSDFRRAARRAAELGEVSFAVLSPTPAEFEALFDEAIAVEVRSWKREAGTAIAVDERKRAFFREYFRAACEAGQFRAAFMRIGDQAVAVQLAVEWSNRYWLFKIGFDEDFGRCSPGTLLMLHTIGWAARRGLAAYELLGDVEPWIAEFWTRDSHPCLRVRTYPFSVSGAVALAADAAACLRTRLARSRT